ncbi:MAG: alkaline phosphatase family protein [Acidimicrobiia bacterium]
MRLPDYAGGGLVNLVAELEHRLIGSSVAPRLAEELARLIPSGDSYLLFLFDGLGDHQLAHPSAGPLALSRRAALDAPFPSTTTASLASVVTGLPPAQHGLLGYQLWMPELDLVVNTLQWTTLWGDPVDYRFDELLPAPNLWERLARAGVEPITIQPGDFLESPLSRVLYRGARFEPVFTADEMVEAALALASHPGRLLLVYLPHVDVAAHTRGQASQMYVEAIGLAAEVWQRVASRLPDGTAMVGTSDHGHLDVPPERRTELGRLAEQEFIVYGDSRMTFLRGDPERAASLAETLPASWVPLEEMRSWWGPGPPHPSFEERAPTGALVPAPGHILLHRFSDRRLIGAHGGLTEEELRVPLLVGGA